jgi:hypothetical protein
MDVTKGTAPVFQEPFTSGKLKGVALKTTLSVSVSPNVTAVLVASATVDAPQAYVKVNVEPRIVGVTVP